MNVTAGAFPQEVELEMASPREDKSVDASRLSFNFQTVAMIVSTALLVSGLQYVTGASERSAKDDDRKAAAQMQSDIRDIHTQMNSQEKIHDLEKQLLDAQLASMKATIENATNRAAALSMSQELSRQQRTR